MSRLRACSVGLLACIAVAAGGLGAVVAAHADPPPLPRIDYSPKSGPPGTVIAVNQGNTPCHPNDLVTISILGAGSIGIAGTTTSADGSGNWNTTITVPPAAGTIGAVGLQVRCSPTPSVDYVVETFGISAGLTPTSGPALTTLFISFFCQGLATLAITRATPGIPIFASNAFTANGNVTVPYLVPQSLPGGAQLRVVASCNKTYGGYSGYSGYGGSSIVTFAPAFFDVTGPPPGSATGVVTVGSFPAVAGALVQLCIGNSCTSTLTDANGKYAITPAPTGTPFTLSVSPPSGSSLLGASTLVFPISSELAVTNFQLKTPLPPPPGTEISNSEGTSDAGLPILGTSQTTQVTTHACAGGSGQVTVSFPGTAFAPTSTLLGENPVGSGNYSALIFGPNHGGTALFSITINCPGGGSQTSSFNVIYLDPSGTVKDQHGNPVAGATVTLLRSDAAAGPFAPVPNNSQIMSPANRTNPDTTPANGTFMWDVVAGYYKVQATAPNCTTATTDVLTIPPPVTGLVLKLACNVKSIDTLGPAKLFVGLRNSDDVGTKFDMRVDVWSDAGVIGSGTKNGVNGGSSGFNNSSLQEIPLTITGPTTADIGSQLSMTVSLRISCTAPGHAAGTGRVWFNDAQANSQLALVLSGSPTTYYLHSLPAMTTDVGGGPKVTADVALTSQVACPDREFIPIGTWSTTIG